MFILSQIIETKNDKTNSIFIKTSKLNISFVISNTNNVFL